MKLTVWIWILVIICFINLLLVIKNKNTATQLRDQVVKMEGAYNSFVPLSPGYYVIKNDSLFCYLSKRSTLQLGAWSLFDVYTLDYNKLKKAYSVKEGK
jgi:hypothetical protein